MGIESIADRHEFEPGPTRSWLLAGSGGVRSKAAHTRARILLVDACPKNRRTMRTALGEFEHDVIEASSTSEAVTAISLHGVDLVLISLLAPEVGANEFCRMLKRAHATQLLPVFVVANSDDIEAEVSAMDAGADEFLIAPLRPKAFRARVQASLRHKAMIDSLNDSEAVLFSLAQSVEERDPTLGAHCERLSLMSCAMGIAMGLPPRDISALQRGGYLHDIGKIAIPDSVLFKAGPLTEEEWTIMKSHTERGERICGHMRSLADVLPIIRHHHERWDGSGYPDGLRGEQIPLLARILQIADVYDALTSSRCYKSALSSDEALEIVCSEARKGWRDKEVVEVFGDVLPMFRTQPPADLSRISLQSLAASVEYFRKSSSQGRPANVFEESQFRLVSGL
ncbi:MAG: HD domain-containing protein [Acidobacteriaceae bacterium]|nr:HD domain-containing protein [Acidobacteriaceae bacterium]